MRRGVAELIDVSQLQEILETFYRCLSLSVQFIDDTGVAVLSAGEPAGFCQLLRKRVFPPSTCQQAHLDAGQRARALGEAYIFACHGGLTHIAFPLAAGNALLGTILVGPFLMDLPDSTLVSALAERRPLPSATLLELYDELSALPVVPPEKVRDISRLLYFLLAPLVPEQRRELSLAQEKLYQQARINETIQMYKTQGTPQSDPYPYEKEKELLTKVKTGDVQAAKGVLNDLLGYVFFCEGGRMETMKNRSLELCTLLSRTAIEGGAVTDSIFRLNNQFLASLKEIDTLEALCHELQEIVEAFVSATLSLGDRPEHDAVRRAVTYIARHYAEPLTLEGLAAHVGLSPAYFSHLFKAHTGSSFREYLGQVRVEESKRLLTMTSYSLVDIAMAMGFSDQSYFSKVFKKYTGLSPKQYR